MSIPKLKEVLKSAFSQHAAIPLPIERRLSKLAGWIRFSVWLRKQGNFPRYGTAHAHTFEQMQANRREFYSHLVAPHEVADFLEFGVFKGESIRWWCGWLTSPSARLVGFDTFAGLPAAWGRCEPGTFNVDGEVPRISDERCTFWKGLFQDALPVFLLLYDRKGRRLIVNLDADIYASTLYVLMLLGSLLEPGDILIFDEFGDPQHEFRAFCDFKSVFNLKYEVIAATQELTRVAMRIQ